MTTGVDFGVILGQVEFGQILFSYIVHSAGHTLPIGVLGLSGAANSRHEFDDLLLFSGQVIKLDMIGQFANIARAVHDVVDLFVGCVAIFQVMEVLAHHAR